MIRVALISVLGLAALIVPTTLAASWVGSAATRLEQAALAPESDTPAVAIAAAADEAYCTPKLKRVLRRVLQSCGLIGKEGGRGCQPVQAKNIATMSGGDFNALFLPMADRAGIVQFDHDSAELDADDRSFIDGVFSARKGASYFFVVSRASPSGSAQRNRELSQERAEAVLHYLESRFQDPDLKKEVGLLWLGEEFAQLDDTFCEWDRSAEENAKCTPDALNRSAFIAWIDCRL